MILKDINLCHTVNQTKRMASKKTLNDVIAIDKPKESDQIYHHAVIKEERRPVISIFLFIIYLLSHDVCYKNLYSYVIWCCLYAYLYFVL